ncbi:flagellar hook-associated protein FlgK [Brevundimonas sp. SORGH_AS_0993]|uniref:flagellar hook-associated protein FlgK n=1 Tax=Brevundimonas sp. SORGH_AS_0993 TaxID=3041794 RepID=UPI0027864DEC|nr:flagellar hook-associated protein FlgK [Brevundimonas sp. SORGH_AS_0993]MDQ1153009.1 flagellar hook-associated protein 1 FlgK [Brevundimonas sp. SORGH_AS_0993]
MSLNSIMNIGASGLQTAQAQLRVTSDNISNVNTVGYVRKIADQSAAVAGGYGAGVEISRVRLATDRFLQAASLSAGADAARHGVRSELYNAIQGQFGDPTSGSGFFAQVDKLFSAYASLAESPTSSAARQDTIYKTQSLFNQAASIGAQIQSVRQEADSRLAGAVETINPLLEQIDKLNKAISAGVATSQDVTAAQNAQQGLISQLSQYLDVKVEPRSNGGVVVRTGGGATLVGEGAATLSYQAAGTVDATTTFADIMVTEPNGTRWPLMDGVSSGQIKGLVELRDVDAPAAAARLGELTARLADELNRAHNANSSVPAPTVLSGRNTGQALETALAGFSGKTTITAVNSSGVVQASAAIVFSGSTMTVNGVAADPTTFLSVLNAQLGGAATASFSNGMLKLEGGNGNGVALADDATTPSDKGGRGFSHWFGLNDLVSSATPTFYETGLTLTSPHGFDAGESVTFRFSGESGSRLRDITVAVPAGTGTMGELLTALNDPVSGVGRYGAFSLDSAGKLNFKAFDPTTQTMSVVQDGTSQTPSGLSMSALFGLGATGSTRAGAYTVRSDIKQDPSKLALAQLNLSAAAGVSALSKNDGRGGLLLGDVGKRSVAFGAAGGNAGGTKTLSAYAADFAGDVGGKASAAKSRAESATALAQEADSRRTAAEGVNMDEELVNMTTFQQAYNASARLIQASKDMYDVLIGMMQ